MKKIIRLMAALAATTVAFSCMEEANPEMETTKKGTHYDGPMTTLTFNLDELETKTTWDGETHAWEDGDQIKIVYSTEDDAFALATIKDGQVTATVGDVETYYAVYPAKTVHSLTETGDFSVTIPKVQNGSFADANIMAAKTSKDDAMFAFKNLTHIFQFTLSEGCEYNLFRFVSNDANDGNNIRLGGTASLITFGEEDVTVGIPATGTGNTKYAVVNLSKNTDKVGPYYLGIRAGSAMENGFGVLASKTGKEGDFTGGLITTNRIETTRSVITKLGAIDNYISDDWYITSTGTGSGKSWSDPAGIELLVKLMQNQKSDGTTVTVPTEDNSNIPFATTYIYRLIDARIHVAAGTYNIFEANGNKNLNVAGLAYDAADRYKSTKITIIGGYPESPNEGDVPTIGENGSNTVFTTNTAQNNRVFDFNNSTIGYLVFDGISFKTAGVNAVGNVNFASNVIGKAEFNNCYFSVQSTNNNQGAAFRSTAGSRVSITLNKCVFANNSTAGNGGAIFKDKEKSTVKFVECDFLSNSAGDEKYGGVGQLSTTVNLEFERCNFSKNSATRGGAIYMNSSANAKFTNCTFTENAASASAYGGAIYMTGSSNASFIDCDFLKNTAKYGGAIANEISTLIVNGCTFTQNSCSVSGAQGGAIVSYDAKLANDYAAISEGKISNLYVYNSSFDSNEGLNQGGSVKVQGSGYAVFVNSSFNNNLTGTNNNGDIRFRNGTGDGVKSWLISCSMNNTKTGLNNQASTLYAYNSIFCKYTTHGSVHSIDRSSTITNTELYTADGSKSGTAVTFTEQIGEFNDGVFPVKAGSVAATGGMSSSELAALGEAGSELMTAMPLFETKYLTVDQKGNERTGSIMGAYVGQ